MTMGNGNLELIVGAVITALMLICAVVLTVTNHADAALPLYGVALGGAATSAAHKITTKIATNGNGNGTAAEAGIKAKPQ